MVGKRFPDVRCVRAFGESLHTVWVARVVHAYFHPDIREAAKWEQSLAVLRILGGSPGLQADVTPGSIGLSSRSIAKPRARRLQKF